MAAVVALLRHQSVFWVLPLGGAVHVLALVAFGGISWAELRFARASLVHRERPTDGADR
jgi:hypothetical protein